MILYYGQLLNTLMNSVLEVNGKPKQLFINVLISFSCWVKDSYNDTTVQFDKYRVPLRLLLNALTTRGKCFGHTDMDTIFYWQIIVIQSLSVTSFLLPGMLNNSSDDTHVFTVFNQIKLI